MSAGRSLRASQEGIQRAKRALKRENLTQKALSSEMAIASWSTISKFFNSKPVDRLIFQEICKMLDLDWSDIALRELSEGDEDAIASDSTPSASEEPNPLLATVKRNSDRARTALNPYILPRITRSEPLEKCLKAIGRGMDRMRRVVPILGAAGYGKSTLLGSIYDALTVPVSSTGERAKHLDSSDSVSPTIDRSNACAPTASPTLPPWVVLVRCNDLIESAETFALELGEKASGERESIVNVAARLTRDCGAGVLLVDTLDIVLERRLVPIFRNLILELLELGTTVAFTCRDRDYRDFFEPYHESFAGFVPNIERQTVAEFTEAEVREAAAAFVGARGDSLAGNSLEGGSLETNVADTQAAAEFADKIIALSANSQSIAEITRNPLLLALLCDLFAKEENVPEDLTVGQLYDTYWNLRVARGRKSHGDSRRVEMAKKNLCLEVACRMYRNSSERLRDFVWETQLQLDDAQLLAYGELKSDGVLAEIGGERIAFFHQTFLEYAIARWLQSTPEGEGAKTELLASLNREPLDRSQHYYWSILRQLLNLVDFAEFDRLSRQFDWHLMLPFHTFALAGVSHPDRRASSILQQLLPLSLQLSDGYRETLILAAGSASARHVDNAWAMMLELISKTNAATSNQAARTAGELLARLKAEPGRQVERVLQAVESRSAGQSASKGKGKNAKEERTHIFGQLVCAYAKAPKTFGCGIDIEVCRAISKHYYRLGSYTRSQAIELHLTPGVPESIRREFLLAIIDRPPHKQFHEKEAACELLRQLLPVLIATGDTPFGQTWLDALHANLPGTWERLQAVVVGERAVGDPQLLADLIDELMCETSPGKAPDRLRHTLMALTGAIEAGGAPVVVTALVAISIPQIRPDRISTLSGLANQLAPYSENLDTPLAESFARWMLAAASDRPKNFLPPLVMLAREFPTVEVLLEPVLEALFDGSSQVGKIVAKFSYIPAVLEPHLRGTVDVKESRLALVKLERQRAEATGSTEAIAALLDFCVDRSREVALSASGVVLALALDRKSLPIDGLVRTIAPKCFPGVRQNGLRSLVEAVKFGEPFAESKLTETIIHLENETVPALIQLLYQTISTWVDRYGFLSEAVVQRVFALTERTIARRSEPYLNGGVANAAFIALTTIANLELPDFASSLCRCTRELFGATDLNRSTDSTFAIGLLERASRLDEQLLSQIVREDLVGGDRAMPLPNQCAVAIAIKCDRGKDSPLLDEILQDPTLSESLKSFVIQMREGK